MSFFDSLFGRKPPKFDDPDELRERLLDAAAKGGRFFEQLCQTNRDAIVTSFGAWSKVPPEVRSDPEATKRYAHALIAVAQLFAEKLGEPSLLEKLMGAPSDNPLIQWQDALDKAQEMMDARRFAEAAELLSGAAERAEGLVGTGADQLLPITLGRLGECRFHGGDVERAVAPTREALRLCEAHGDREGVAVYLGNLYEIHRYLGEAKAAAGYAERLASALSARGDEAEATRYRAQARRVLTGEPEVRVVMMLEGRRYELDEAPRVFQKFKASFVTDARVKFVFERNRITLRPALELTRQGELRGSEGEYERALVAFRAAAAADPHDPHCRYLEGLTLLAMQRPAEAVTSYEACEARAPGWFLCRTDLWLAREMAAGRLDDGAFLALRELENDGLSPASRAELARRVLKEHPRLAPLHLELGKAVAALGRKGEAEASFRQGLECVEEPCARTSLLVELAMVTGSVEERQKLLEDAVALNGNLTAAAMARLLLSGGAASPRSVD